MDASIIENYINCGKVDELLTFLQQTNKCESFQIYRGSCIYNINFTGSGLQGFLEKKLSPYFEFNDSNDDFNSYRIIVFKMEGSISVPSLLGGELIRIVPNEKDPRKNIQARAIDIGDIKVYLMEKTNNIVLINKKCRELALVGSNELALFDDCRLLIRDLTNITIINDGYVEVHASAICDSDGNVTMICGESNSGKTTMLFNLLKENKMNLLSNGRVYIKINGEVIHALGTPESIYIRPITATGFPELNDLLKETPQSEIFSLNCDIKYKIKTTYKDICERFKVSPAVEGKLKSIIIPSLSNAKKLIDIKSSLNFIIGEHIFSYSQVKRREWVQCLLINENEYMNNALEVKKLFENGIEIFFAGYENGKYIIERR